MGKSKKGRWRKADFKQRATLPVADILETLRLDELLDALGLRGNTYHGKIRMPCPLPSHGGVDSNPSFAIMPEGLSYNCFVCGSGRVVDLVMALENVSEEEALLYMAQYSDASSLDEDHLDFLKRLEGYLKRPARTITRPGRTPDLPWFNKKLLEPWIETAPEVKDFWNSRFISMNTVKEFRLGYAEEYVKGDYVGPAIIIPHFVSGVLTGWQARFLEDDRPKYVPKYDNTDDFPKQETLFNYDRVRLDGHDGPTYVVEAALTVARLHTAQIPAVGTFGASVSNAQMRLLKFLAQNGGIILSYDDDPAGRKITEKLTESLYRHGMVDVIPPHILSEVSGGLEKPDLGDLNDAQLAEATMFHIPHNLR